LTYRMWGPSSPQLVNSGAMTDPLAVLIVKHSPGLPPGLAQALQENDEVVVIAKACEGKRVLELARALQPQVILVELAECVLTGLAIIRQLRAAAPAVGIIALTALANPSYWEVILAAGADEVVATATLSADLLPAIRRAARTNRLSGVMVRQDGSEQDA